MFDCNPTTYLMFHCIFELSLRVFSLSINLWSMLYILNFIQYRWFMNYYMVKNSYLLIISYCQLCNFKYSYRYLRINFYLLRTFCPHLGSFCVVSSFTTFRLNFTSSLLQVILPRPRIGMLSLVTVSPVITVFHSCHLSHLVFDQVNV